MILSKPQPANLANIAVQRAIKNTIEAENMDEKYPLGARTFHRPHGSYISNVPGGSSLLPEDAPYEDVFAIPDLLSGLNWIEITNRLNEGERMGKCRYYEADLPEWVEAYEAATHFTTYLNLINASEDVRKGQQPVPGLTVFVAFHQGPDLSSTILPPQKTNKVVISIGATEWREELSHGSHWHMMSCDPLEAPKNTKAFFWAPGSVYPAGQTVKLFRL